MVIKFGPKWDNTQEVDLRQLLKECLENTKVIVVAGAGISASAGRKFTFSLLFKT